LCFARSTGKTTLIDAIAGRKTSGKLDGGIYVNGMKKSENEALFKRITGQWGHDASQAAHTGRRGGRQGISCSESHLCVPVFVSSSLCA
jgi:hypothetical protein